MRAFLKFLTTLAALAAAFCALAYLFKAHEPEYIEIYSDGHDDSMPY